MQSFQTLFFPLVLLLNSLGNGLLKLCRISRSSGSANTSLQDLQFVVHQSQEAGALAGDSAQVLRELLEFTDMDAGELMVPRVHMAALPQHCSAQELRELLLNYGHSRYPVYGKGLDDVLGFVHLKDLYRLVQTSPSHSELVIPHEGIRPLPFLPATAELETVIQRLYEDQVRMVILLDEMGGTAGLLTLEDILTELFGPIDSEALAEAEIRQQSDGCLQVSGTLRLEELEEYLERPVAHSEVETISGLVLDLLERPPVVGDTVHYAGLTLTVLELAGRGVKLCSLSLPEGTNDKAEAAKPSPEQPDP